MIFLAARVLRIKQRSQKGEEAQNQAAEEVTEEVDRPWKRPAEVGE